ncbi:MAG: hypothetical protein Kow0026_11070 [Oricola sp.]
MTDTLRNGFDISRAAEHYRLALLRIVAALFGMAGHDADATLQRHLRNRLLRIIRPAESAARRLIVIAARGVEIAVLPASPLKGGRRNKTAAKRTARPIRVQAGAAEAGRFSSPPGSVTLRVPIADLPERTRSKPRHTCVGYPPGCRPEGEAREPAAGPLPLLDPLKRIDFAPRRGYARGLPRVRSLSAPALPVYMRCPEPEPPHVPTPGDPLDARPLRRRLAALESALENIGAQAVRLARWQARRDFQRRQPNHRPGRISPMRPGWPPGYRKRPLHEIDDVLRECHSLAVRALTPDTS